MAKKVLINSPILNELAFDYLFTLTAGQREKLDAKQLRAIKTAKKARHYVSNTTLDEKLYLLAKLGVQFSFILHNNNPLAGKEIKALYEKYKEMSKGAVLEDMAAEKFVVMTDRVLINFLNLMGQYSHSDTFLLNLDFHRVGQHLNNWKEEMPDVDNMQQSLEFAKIINRFALNVSLEMKTIKGVSDIGDLDFNILMYLYDNRAVYTAREKVESYLGGLYKKTLISAALKRLQEKILIDRSPVSKVTEYQITSMGINSVMEFHRKILAET